MPTSLRFDPEARQTTENFWALLDSGESVKEKQAGEAATGFLRMQLREDCVVDRFLVPSPVNNSDLDRQVDTPLPTIVLDKEPGSPPAISVPFATQPMARYIRAPRYRAMFDRVLSTRFQADTAELRTYDMDIRQILSDNSVKDMSAEKDGKVFATVNTILGSTPNVALGETGVVQYKTIAGGVSRESVVEARKILPSTPSHFEAATVVVNNVTIKDVEKWGFEEMGGSMSEDILKNGYGERNLLNMRWIATIKRRLVPDNNMYMFCEQKGLGVSFELEAPTMYVKREGPMIEFYSYASWAVTLGNVAGFCRVVFTN